jgi:uncharacterized protein (DUF1800 family)
VTYGTIGNDTLPSTTTSTRPLSSTSPSTTTTGPSTTTTSSSPTSTTTTPAADRVAPAGFSSDPALRHQLGHLFRRAGFGASAARLDAAEQAGYAATVEVLLTPGDPVADTITPPTLTAPPASPPSGVDEKTLLIVWWLQRMAAAATNPLAEKLPWFWHGHLTSSLVEVGSPYLMWAQNQLFRTHGRGDFPTLVRQITTDRAMMVYLDLLYSKKTAPNENYPRELCELFVLGRTDHTGTSPYTEADVQAASRAMTGWVLDATRTSVVFDPTRWDNTTKTFLGQTGAWSTDDIVRIVTRHPAAARRIPARLWSFFAHPVGSADPVVAELATTFAAELDLTNLLRRIFLHPAFQSATARHGRVKSPVEWVIGTYRALGMTPDAATLGHLRTLLEYPLHPPTVAGWPANGYWINTVSALDRARVAQAIAKVAPLAPIAALTAGERPAAIATLLGIELWSARTAAALATVQGDPISLLALALVSPEYVLN